MNNNSTNESTNPHSSITNNNSPVLSIIQETNYQINSANSNELIVSAASQISMENNIQQEQEQNVCTNVGESNSSDQVDSANSNESTVSTASQISMENNIQQEQEQNVCTNVGESNSSDQVDSANGNESIVLTASQNSMENNVLEQEQEQNLYNNETNDPHDVMSDDENDINPNPIRIYVNERVSLERTAPGEYKYILNPGQTENLDNNFERDIAIQIEHQRRLVMNNVFPEPVPTEVMNQRIIDLKREQLFDREPIFNLWEPLLLRAQSNINGKTDDQINSANSNELYISAASLYSMENNIQQEQEQNVGESNSSDQVDSANSNESTVSTASQISMENNIQQEQEQNVCTNVGESNSSDQVDSANSNESTVSTASQISMENNIQQEQEQNVCTNVGESNSSDQVHSLNSNESILENNSDLNESTVL